MKELAIDGTRTFYQLPDQPAQQPGDSKQENEDASKHQLASYINNNIIGSETTFLSPFGRRRTVYCDYTASGKSLSFIEDYIREEVLPLYGNTHTTTSVTSLQTTLYRHEARDIVRNAVNAGEQDAVVFVGSGCTGAVNKLVSALGDIQDCVVLVGPHEHHSNILPWKEAAGETIIVGENCETGSLDIGALELELQKHKGRRIIGAFSICSNVTGVLEDDLTVTSLLHKYGAFAFWDYAAAAPYVNIDMNPKVPEDTNGLCYKDAIYFSMHKFVGGVQTPGVLVAKKYLFRAGAPEGPGGGTVFFVSENHHRYLKDIESREEGGTPYIVESIRAGLVMKLKQEVGATFILDREHQVRARALACWSSLKSLVLLGPDSPFQIPIFSFLVKHPHTGLYLHYNFVVSLLNDLFGIQARGGCVCAGPYMQKLLGLEHDQTLKYEDILLEDSRLDRVGLRRGCEEHSQWEVLRPGSTRLNLSWFSSEEEVDFVIEAVRLVAEQGWKLLPLYRFNNETGDWYHSGNTKFKDRRWLGHISFRSGKMEVHHSNLLDIGVPPNSFKDCLDKAREILSTSEHLAHREVVPDQVKIFPPHIAGLRWFVTPSEAKCALLTPEECTLLSPPFTPPRMSKGLDKMPGTLESSFILSSPQLSSILLSSGKYTPWTLIPKVHYTTATAKAPSAALRVDPLNISKKISEEVPMKDHGSSNNVIQGIPTDTSLTVSETTPTASETNPTASETNPTASETTLTATETTPTEELSCVDGTCVLPGGKRDTEIPVLKPQSARWCPPSKEIFKPFLEAVTEFGMIQDGDRVLVGLSGGKDSLSLLHTIRQYMFYAKKNGTSFSMGAVTVDPMSSAYDPRPLIPYLSQLGIEYLYEEQDIMAQALKVDASSICAFCSRMKRGRLYAAARRSGYNVLALGQHLDDISESFFMSVFHNGRLRTMKAHYTNAEGDLRIIRPFVYVRENALRQFAESRKLPIIAENCPACFESPKERQRIKQLLAQQELLFPRLYWNLKTALYPVMCVNKTGLESAIFGKQSSLSTILKSTADKEKGLSSDEELDL